MGREVNELKREMCNLSDKNSTLTQMLEEEQRENEKHQKNTVSISQKFQDAQDEICALEGLLEAARKESEVQRNEVQKIRSSLQEKIVQVQKVESEGQHLVLEELLATRSREVDKLNEQVRDLSDTLKDTEDKL